jgi:hypothetical protein
MVTLVVAVARDSQRAVVAFDVPVVDVGAERFANPAPGDPLAARARRVVKESLARARRSA